MHRENPQRDRLTGRAHLRDAGHVRLVVELRSVVVDVLHRDDELRLRLLGLVGVPVHGLRLQDVEGLLLAVQPLQHADVTVPLVNLKQVAGAFPRQHVLDGAVAPVRVRLELRARETRKKDYEVENVQFLKDQRGRQGHGGRSKLRQPPVPGQ